MPVIGAIVGAIMTGFMYWLFWGRGLEYIDHRLSNAANAKRSRQQRALAEERRRTAPLRDVSDPRDAAAILMFLVAGQRGVPTPEQVAVITGEMTGLLALGDEIPERLALARFSAETAGSFDHAFEALGPLLRDRLTPAERAELVAMLRKVADVHGGPTPDQERAVGYADRYLARP
jgi:hypothetical protein